eukprot:2778523-Alexandrium_andersonii.AAC.1
MLDGGRLWPSPSSPASAALGAQLWCCELDNCHPSAGTEWDAHHISMNVCARVGWCENYLWAVALVLLLR